MVARSYLWLFWLLALAGAGADQVSKYGVFRWLYVEGGQNTRPVVEGRLELLVQHTNQRATSGQGLAPLRTWSGEALPHVNEGALFGRRLSELLDWLAGRGLIPNSGYQWIDSPSLAAVSLLAALAIIYWTTRRATARDRALCVALGLILAGTLGNLYDRVVFGGVRDFLHFHWYSFAQQKVVFDWPVFNVADCCLVAGAFLLLAQAFWARPVPAEQESAAATLASEPVQVG